MKNKRILKTIKLIVLLIFSVNAYAQRDLTFNSATTSATYFAEQFQVFPVVLDFEVQNIGSVDASVGVDFELRFDDLNFNFNPTVSNLNGWSCSPLPGPAPNTGITCFSNGTLAFGTSVILNMAIDVGSTAPIGMYVFDGTVVDTGGLEPSFNQLNNTISTIVDLTAAAATDFELTIDPGITVPILIPDNATGTFPVAFNIENLGATEGSSEFISIIVDPSITLSNVLVTGGGANPIWGCNPSASGWDCFNSNTSNGMLPGAIASITGDITGYPSTQVMIPSAIDARVSVSGDINLLNDQKIVAVNIVAAAPDLSVTLIEIDGNAGLTQLDFPEGTMTAQNVHFRVVNSIAAAGNGAQITFSYDPASFSLTSTTIPGMWTCGPPVSGVVTCTDPSLINIGATFDFFFDLTPISTTLTATTYASLDATVSDTNNAELPGTQNDNNASVPVSVVTVVLQTDLELKKFAKDVVGGSIITNIEQDLQFVYAIQVNNLSVTAANTVVVTDNIPIGIEIISSAQSIGGWSCTIGTFVISVSQLVTCTNPTIAASQPNFTDFIYLDAFGRVSSASPVINTASVTSTEADLNSADNTGSASVTISAPVLTTTYDVVPITSLEIGTVGSNFYFPTPKSGLVLDIGTEGIFKVLGVATTTPAAALGKSNLNKLLPVGIGASNVVLDIPIPTGMSYVSHTIIGPNNFSCAFDSINNSVSCTAAVLPADITGEDGVFVTVIADGPAGTFVTFSSSISADVGSNVLTSNDSSFANPFGISLPAYELDLTISKSAQFVGGSISTNQFLVAQNFEYKLMVTNLNSNTAEIGDVLIYDSMPSGIDLDAIPTSPGWDCSNSSAAIVDCINTVSIAANGGTLELIVPVSSQVVSASPIQNIANADVSFNSTAFEVNTSDNSAFVDVNIISTLPSTTLTATKDAIVSGSPVTTISSGTNFDYRITVTNTGAADAVNVVMIDTLATGLSVNNTSGSGWSCSNVGQKYTCTFPGPLAPGASTFVDLNVPNGVASNIVQIINNVDVTADNAPLAFATNDLAVTESRAELIVDVTQNPVPIDSGESFELVIKVKNPGSSRLSRVQVENTLPEGFSYASTPNKTLSCVQNGLLMSCEISSVLRQTSEFISLQVNAIDVVDPNIIYTNTTVVTQADIDGPITNNLILDVNQVEIDVSLTKSASINETLPSSSFSYTLSVSNLGLLDATEVTVIDNMPNGVELVSMDAPGWSCSGTSQIICMTNLLVAGSSSDIVLNVLAPSAEGNITNSAQVSIAEQDTNSSNDNSEVSVDVTTGAGGSLVANLQLTKTTSTPTLVSGEQFNWIIEVQNKGPDTANNVVVNDLIPVGFELTSVTISDGLCQNTESEINCQIPFIIDQNIINIEVSGTATVDSGEFVSTATVASDTTDPVPDNNSGTVTITVTPVQVIETDLSVTIDSGNAIDQGDSVDFIINVFNNGPDIAHAPVLNIAVTGLLESITSNQGNDWSCLTSGFVVNCSFTGTVLENGQLSSVGLTVKTSQLILDAEDVVVIASILTADTDNDSNLDNNTVTSVIGVSGTPTLGEIGDALRGALGSLGSTGDPILDNAIEAVSGFCEVRYFTALEGLCDSLYNAALDGDRDTINTFLRQITPNEVIGQSTSVAEIAGAQFRNIGARLNQLRGGGGSGFSSAGLNARYGNGSIPLGMLAYLNQTDKETDGLTKIPDDFITPWGFFVNGSISMGKRDATGRELGFDFDTYGLTAGFDYRLDAKKVIGIALGYANFDSNVDGAAQLKSTGVTLTGYGSFYVNDNFYVDARISYGKPKFDQSRNIDFTLGGTRIDRTAIGNTNANQYSFAVSAGYSFYKNAWNITPNASLSYVKTNIDSFTETGAGDFNIIYSEQQWDSLLWSAGLKVSKAISLKKGVITPQIDFDYNYESKNNGQDIIAHFINAPSDQIFIIETDSPDRTYGSAGLGLVYISANGKQAYINYRSVLGLEGFSRGTFNLGARFEF